MSVVTVQLGQCGNQIGGQFFSTIIDDVNKIGVKKDVSSMPGCSKLQDNDFNDLSLETFFHRPEVHDAVKVSKEVKPKARAVLVDMESKVITQTIADAKKSQLWSYSEKQQFCEKSGSGNNWAHGFSTHGPRCKERVMDIVRKEVEKCERFGGFLAVLSLAGGTGSGVGTFISQCLRDEYPDSFIINQVIWPYTTGEVIVQNYNAVLTLSHLYQYSDAILTLENDSLQKICSQLLNIRKVSFKDINEVVAHKMASVLQPAFVEGTSNLSRNHIGDILEHLISQPEYKLLTMCNIPQMSETSLRYSTYQWPGLLKHLRQMLIASSAMEEGIDWHVKASPNYGKFNRSVANAIFLRGTDIKLTDMDIFKEQYLYSSWVPPQYGCQVFSHPRAFRNYEKSAALLCNSQTPIKSLDTIVGKAWNMFSSRAYLHQYFKHGLNEDDFMDCFATLEQVISTYKSL